jgi:signal transduction protein with GAF and PtsI domain
MTADDHDTLALLAAVARRVAAADRLTPRADDEPLAAIVGAAVVALEAQAASIALHDPAADRLVFTAAAGPAAGDIVGMSIEPASGIAGYVFTTGQPLAVADVTADPRFERTVAEASGYVPSSLLAVPVTDETGTIGVLEALDRRGGTFSLRDLDVATSIAGLAAIAIRRGRVHVDARVLLTETLSELVADPDATAPDAAAVEALVSRATDGLARDDDPTWALTDRIARLRDVDPDAVELAVDWLDALLRHRGGRPS